MSAASQVTDGWRAQLELGLESRGARTALVHRKQRGPLAVQRPFYPEGGVCHLYLLHPPGGVVGGDGLEVDVAVHADAHALLTTPGATKFYRSSGPQAQLRQTLSVAAGAALEWFPQENIFFPGARARLRTEVRLEPGARFMGWEIHCLGRPVNHETFDTGALNLRLDLDRGATPLLRECLNVEGGAVSGPATLRDYPVNATFLAGGATPELRDLVRERLSETDTGLAAATLLEDLLVVRYLGTSTAAARRLFVAAWTALRPALLGRAACSPRIWAT